MQRLSENVTGHEAIGALASVLGVKHEQASALLSAAGGPAGIAALSDHEIAEALGSNRKAMIERVRGLVQFGLFMARDPLGYANRPTIGNPLSAKQIAWGICGTEAREVAVVLILNTRHQVVGYERVCEGQESSCNVDVGQIMRAVLGTAHKTFLFVHNHPSGDPSPSHDDLVLTKSLAQAAKLLDLNMLDALIVGPDPTRYVSLKERGVL